MCGFSQHKKGVVGIYRKVTYDMGVIRQIEKSFPANYGAPGEKREKKQKRTPEDVRRQNERNRWKRVQRIILANFHEGDWHLVLKYKSLPSRGRGLKSGIPGIYRC